MSGAPFGSSFEMRKYCTGVEAAETPPRLFRPAQSATGYLETFLYSLMRFFTPYFPLPHLFMRAIISLTVQHRAFVNESAC